MINDIKDPISKITKNRVVVGLDLSDDFAMVSYYSTEEPEPITIGTTLGGDDICIPSALGKYYAENNWVFGSEAYNFEDGREGTLITGLLQRARLGSLVTIESKEYDPVDLLALYMKKCFSLLAVSAPIEKVAAITITVNNPDTKTIEIIKRAIETLRIKPEKVFIQSHSESVFYYMINQRQDLWTHDVVVCDIDNDGLLVRTMKKNVHTSPIVVLMEENRFDHIKSSSIIDAIPAIQKQKDNELLHVMQGMLSDHLVSSVYLIGDAFGGDWWKESLTYMSKNRRVFRGNNLFSKGAAYSAMEKIEQSVPGKKHVFLGRDKVKANVGMRVIRDGEEVYMALLDAGKNWYETKRECELILDHEDVLNFIVTPLTGNNVKTVSMYLTGIPIRQKRSTRIRLELKMTSERRLLVTCYDMGFGEFFESSGLYWNSEIVMD